VKPSLTPQQKKTNSYAKDRRNAYGERGANSRFAIRSNKDAVERHRRRSQDASLRDVRQAVDADDLAAAENQVRARPTKGKNFSKHADTALGVVVNRKLARRERQRSQPDLSPMTILHQDFCCQDQARLVIQARQGVPSWGWQLPPEEVQCNLNGSGGTWRLPGHYNVQLQLWHLPTGLTIAASSLRQEYTRTQFREVRDALYLLLYAELEWQVVKHLHIPGYGTTEPVGWFTTGSRCPARA